MSQAVFPTFPGSTFNTVRQPMWNTSKKESVSGREFRAANWTYPRYKYKLAYEFLRQGNGYTEFSQLVGFFNARQGDFDTFLFSDPDDNSVTAQVLGIGDGVNKNFQLIRSFGGFVEPVLDVNSVPAIYVNGVLQTLTTHYTISATGLVVLVTAPTAGQTVTWTGTYYRRVTFAQSMAELTKFMYNLWSLRTLELVSQKP